MPARAEAAEFEAGGESEPQTLIYGGEFGYRDIRIKRVNCRVNGGKMRSGSDLS